MNRRDFLCSAAAGALSLGAMRGGWAETKPGAARRPPNIVFIVADDLGYGDLACYGNPHNQTPNIDRFALEGLRFTDFHTNGPMCSPTRAALLTGRYQNRYGAPFEGPLSEKEPEIGLPSDIPSIPRLLKDAGYATAMFGKWHLGMQAPHLPNDFGFDEFRGLLTGDGDHISHMSRSGVKDWYHNRDIEMEKGYSAELITDHSIEFMREHRDEPFFIYAAHLAIHFPWQAPGEAAHRKEGVDYWGLEKLGPHAPGEVAPVVRAMVEAVDASVGRIVGALEELGLSENTLVFFTSDNGGYRDYGGRFQGEISSNGPLRGQKSTLWEGGHRVPAIACWPGHIRAGVTDQTAITMDLLPTLAELAAAPAPEPLDGTTLAPLLLHGKSVLARDLFWRDEDEKAVRRGPWKLVVEKEQPPELFNLDKDLGERNDLSAQEPELLQQLLDALKRWEGDVGEQTPAPASA